MATSNSIFQESTLKILSQLKKKTPFLHPDLPLDYIGLPLKEFIIDISTRPGTEPIKMVAYKETFALLNSYRQYLIHRNSFEFSPKPGDIVLDCGACIGDISLLFAKLVSLNGEVHLFDPIPLHTRFCRLQADNNPSLTDIFTLMNSQSVIQHMSLAVTSLMQMLFHLVVWQSIHSPAQA